MKESLPVEQAVVRRMELPSAGGDCVEQSLSGLGQPLEFRQIADRVQVGVLAEQIVPEASPQGRRQQCERLGPVSRVLAGGQGIYARDLVKRGRSVVGVEGGFGILISLRVLTQAGVQDAAPT